LFSWIFLLHTIVSSSGSICVLIFLNLVIFVSYTPSYGKAPWTYTVIKWFHFNIESICSVLHSMHVKRHLLFLVANQCLLNSQWVLYRIGFINVACDCHDKYCWNGAFPLIEYISSIKWTDENEWIFSYIYCFIHYHSYR
jgi:hypothetical protein